MWVLPRVGVLRKLWVRDLSLAKPVPVFLWWFVRVMWVDKAGDHQKWDVMFAGLIGSHPVVEVAQTAETNFVVEVLLHRGL